MKITRLVAMLALIHGCTAYAAGSSEPVMLNFVNADIDTVVKAIGEISGRNFVLDPRVKGTLNIVSSRPVPRALTYQILLSSLRMQGFAAVEGSGFTKILSESDAKLHARVGNPRKGEPDQLITKVFALRNGSASQMLPVVRPIISPNNSVSVFPQANALVVTDYADNIRRIESIIESVESAASGDMAVMPVQFGSAVELAGMLNKLLQDAGGADSGKTSIVPDGRANVLLVKADTPGKMGKIKSLLKMLDQPSQAGANIRVVYLKNADAVRVAQTLRAVLSSDAGQLPSQARGVPANAPSAASSQLAGAAAGSSGTATSAAPAAANPASGPAGSATAPAGDAAPGAAGSMIQADSTNNALILNVPDAMYRNLRNVIDQLDKRRAQVYIETLVMEVQANRNLEVGVQWSSLGNKVFGYSNFPGNGNPGIVGVSAGVGAGGAVAQTTLTGLANAGGMTVGVANGTISFGGQTLLNLGALARAMETEAQANLLANPNVMATDNQQASISIGKEIPVVTGSYANTGSGSSGSVNPFTTVDRKKVGFSLDITPQISEGGTIRMRISQVSASLDAASQSSLASYNSGSGANPPAIVTNYRTIDTAVTVEDGGIIAIGGLVQDDTSVREDKVPLLGDIPFLGGLFRYKVQTRNKTNLLVFLKPTIVRDDVGAQAIAGDRYNYIVGEVRKSGDKKLSLDPAAGLNSLPSGITPMIESFRKPETTKP